MTPTDSNELLYCAHCIHFTTKKWEAEAMCDYTINVDIHHPIKPQTVKGDCMTLNKDNNCPHHVSQQSGLGMVGR